MSASVADTRVDLVSSSTFDVSLVILAESDVLDRSTFSVAPPISKSESPQTHDKRFIPRDRRDRSRPPISWDPHGVPLTDAQFSMAALSTIH